MKYHDSMTQANDKLLLVMNFLQKYRLPPHPVNYTVIYEYVTGEHQALFDAISQREQQKLPIDNYVMETLYQQFIVKDDPLEEEIIQETTVLLSDVEESTQQIQQGLSGYLKQLDHHQAQLTASHLHKNSIQQLLEATLDIYSQQQQIVTKLEVALIKANDLQSKFSHWQTSKIKDQLTGVYHLAELKSHIDLWAKQQPDVPIAAIAVDLDHFSEINSEYGFLVGDIILSKIAHKIQQYFQDSGVLARMGGEEFIILVKDVDLPFATEIAEQVRRGVEKMRFISSKEKRRLPNITVSLAVSDYNPQDQWDKFIHHLDEMILLAKKQGRNQVVTQSFTR